MATEACEDRIAIYVGNGMTGKPYNWGQYGYLLHLLCSITGLKPGRFIVNVDDLHLYSNHIEPIRQILERESRPDPKFQWKRRPSSIDDSLSVDDFEVVGYQPQGFIKLPVAV